MTVDPLQFAIACDGTTGTTTLRDCHAHDCRDCDKVCFVDRLSRALSTEAGICASGVDFGLIDTSLTYNTW
jgi:hypothetical protein